MINRLPPTSNFTDWILENYRFIGRDSQDLPLIQNQHKLRLLELNKDLYHGLQSDIVNFIRSNKISCRRSIELLEQKCLKFYGRGLSDAIEEFSSGLEPRLIINSIFANSSYNKYSLLYFNSFNQELRKKFPKLQKMIDSYNKLIHENNIFKEYELSASELVEMQNPNSKTVFDNFFDRIFLVAQRANSFELKEKVLAHALRFYYIHSETRQKQLKSL